MKVRGGDVKYFALAGREMDIAYEAELTIIPGGFTNESLPTGNGRQHVNKRQSLPGIDDVQISVDEVRDDVGHIRSVSNSTEAVPCTMITASDTTYVGSVFIEGEYNHNTGNGTCSFAVRGENFGKI